MVIDAVTDALNDLSRLLRTEKPGQLRLKEVKESFWRMVTSISSQAFLKEAGRDI